MGRSRATFRLRARAVDPPRKVALTTTALPAHAADGPRQVVFRGVAIPALYTPPAELPEANGAITR
ncbi:hypothetical protein ACWD4J_42515 [Streptomyces sp. NPDC002577]